MTSLVQVLEEGLDREGSPIFSPSAMQWSKHTALKASLFSLFLLIASFFLSFFPHLFPLSNHSSTVALSSFFLSIVYLLSGTPTLIHTLQNMRKGSFDIDLLMVLSAYAALLIGQAMEGAFLLVLFSLSHAIEHMVTAKAKGAIRDFRSLSPKQAYLVHKGEAIEKSVKDISIGDRILVRAGEIVPLDGKVVEGISSIQISHLTGESLPIRKSVDDEISSGSQLIEGSLTLQVTRTSADSTIAQMITMISKAQSSRPKLQCSLDRIMNRYSLLILSSTLFIALGFPLFLSIPYLHREGSFYRALTFLIGASPCALIIAIPIAYLSALSSSLRHGIFLKGGTLFDILLRCKHIAFDKTGTLTTGELVCKEILSLQENHPLSKGEKYDNILSLASSLEQYALHPIAQAIVNKAKKEGLSLSSLQESTSFPGSGIRGIWKDPKGEEHLLSIGNQEFIAEKLSQEKREEFYRQISQIERTDQEENIHTYFLFKKEIFYFRFVNTFRSQAKQVITELREKYGLQPMILSGDHRENVQKIAEQLQIEEFSGDLTPEKKLQKIEEKIEEGLIMVGDGLNDAPALAKSTVGIVLGKKGDTTTVHSSDIVLLEDRLDRICWLMRKATDTRRIVLQNLFLAGIAIVSTALCSLGGILPLWLVILIHEGGTLLVGGNGLRLLRRK